jgi:hypothetical protein
MRAIHVLSTPSMIDGPEISASGRQQTFHIDLSNAHSKSALIEAIRVGMGLPDYCGTNWDALEECLRDLEEDKDWFLIFENADELLQLPTSQLSAFLSILSDTAEFWKSEGRSFRIALIGSPPLAAAVEDIGSPPAPA